MWPPANESKRSCEMTGEATGELRFHQTSLSDGFKLCVACSSAASRRRRLEAAHRPSIVPRLLVREPTARRTGPSGPTPPPASKTRRTSRSTSCGARRGRRSIQRLTLVERGVGERTGILRPSSGSCGPPLCAARMSGAGVLARESGVCGRRGDGEGVLSGDDRLEAGSMTGNGMPKGDDGRGGRGGWGEAERDGIVRAGRGNWREKGGRLDE